MNFGTPVDISVLETYPTFNFMSEITGQYHLNSSVSMPLFQDLFKDGVYSAVISQIRSCVGDQAVLNVIKDLSLQGINDTNNPPITDYVFNDDWFFVGRADEPATLGTDPITQMNPTYSSKVLQMRQSYPKPLYQDTPFTGTLYQFGNHHSLDRINRFWKVFFRRLLWGDSVFHAVAVAKLDLRFFQLAGAAFHMQDYAMNPPNYLVGESYFGTDPKIFTSDIVSLGNAIKNCLINLYVQTYQSEDPVNFGIDVKNAASLNLPSTSPSAMLDSSGNIPFTPNSLNIIGIAMFAIGLLILLKRE